MYESENYAAQLQQAKKDVISGHVSDVENMVLNNEIEDLSRLFASLLGLDNYTLDDLKLRWGAYIEDRP